MEDLKVRKLREKLGISAEDQRAAAGKAISPNLRQKIPGYPGSGGNFVSAPSAVAANHPGSGGNFVSAPSVVAAGHPGSGGNFVSAPSVTD